MGLSDRTMNLISSALRLSTRKQYLGHIKKWGIYCLDNNLDQKAKNVLAVSEFLQASIMIIDGATVPSIVPQVHSPITYHKERSGTRWERTPGKKTSYSEIWDVGVVSQHAEELVAHNSVVTSVTDQEDGYAHGVILPHNKSSH